jgi:PBP1b-binding outer membrane lipoprotein LpoB
MRTGALLLLIAAVLAGCTKTPAGATVSTTSTTATTATTATTDNRSAAEKTVGAGLRARDKAEELKREADAKAKETDATNE